MLDLGRVFTAGKKDSRAAEAAVWVLFTSLRRCLSSTTISRTLFALAFASLGSDASTKAPSKAEPDAPVRRNRHSLCQSDLVFSVSQCLRGEILPFNFGNLAGRLGPAVTCPRQDKKAKVATTLSLRKSLIYCSALLWRLWGERKRVGWK